MEKISLYNTLTRSKEEFKPIQKNLVSFYQCGPTVYWVQHLGNMRAMVLADLIVRSLTYLGYEVKFARNYTDVGHLTSDADLGEDKMEKAAKREQKTPQEIAEHYIKLFEDDVLKLNCLPPDYQPRATEYIEPMKKMVQKLIDGGFAYATELAIYFDVSKFENYTNLSGQNLEMNQADAGSGEVSDPEKKHFADFSLWYFKKGAHKNALQTWPFEFKFSDGSVITGEGFPGWHLECSAMNLAIFGPSIDLHMGGVEHVPVHHTNEIAQSESANNAKFVSYWLHNEHLNVDNGKMSKSAGTAYNLENVLEKNFDPLALRFFFLQAHYRSKQNFTWEALIAANTAYSDIKNKIGELPDGGKIIEKYQREFIASISDDFNLPKALAVCFNLLKSNDNPADIKATLLDFDKVLGLNLSLSKKVEIPAEIIQLAKDRQSARQEKNWDKADELRNLAASQGYLIEDVDSDAGFIVKKK